MYTKNPVLIQPLGERVFAELAVKYELIEGGLDHARRAFNSSRKPTPVPLSVGFGAGSAGSGQSYDKLCFNCGRVVICNEWNRQQAQSLNIIRRAHETGPADVPDTSGIRVYEDVAV
jgi:hypothetical protein